MPIGSPGGSLESPPGDRAQRLPANSLTADKGGTIGTPCGAGFGGFFPESRLLERGKGPATRRHDRYWPSKVPQCARLTEWGGWHRRGAAKKMPPAPLALRRYCACRTAAGARRRAANPPGLARLRTGRPGLQGADRLAPPPAPPRFTQEMAKDTFRVVTRGTDGTLHIRDYNKSEALQKMHTQIGIDDCSTDLGLRGQPVFRGLMVPCPRERMWFATSLPRSLRL